MLFEILLIFSTRDPMLELDKESDIKDKLCKIGLIPELLSLRFVVIDSRFKIILLTLLSLL